MARTPCNMNNWKSCTQGMERKGAEEGKMHWRREELLWHRGDFSAQIRTFLMLEKPSQQTPSRLQIPEYVGGADTGREMNMQRQRCSHGNAEWLGMEQV